MQLGADRHLVTNKQEYKELFVRCGCNLMNVELVSNFKQWLNGRWPLTELGSHDIVNSSSNDFIHPLFPSHCSKFLLPNSGHPITHKMKTLLRIIHLNYSRFDNLIGAEKSIGMFQVQYDSVKNYLLDSRARDPVWCLRHFRASAHARSQMPPNVYLRWRCCF